MAGWRAPAAASWDFLPYRFKSVHKRFMERVAVKGSGVIVLLDFEGIV